MKLSWRFLLRLSISELLNQKRLGIFFILNLTIGLLSFVLLDSFKESLDEYLTENSRAMMTSDMRVYARRLFKPDEEKLLLKEFGRDNTAQRTSYMTMSSHGEDSKLVQVNIIDENYPIYGELLLKDFNGQVSSIADVRARLQTNKVIAIFPELAYYYGIEAGDEITINDIAYEVLYIVEQDAGGSLNFASIAPKVYIAEEIFDKTFFEQLGITLRSYRYIRSPADFNLDSQIVPLRENFKAIAVKENISPPLVRAHNKSGTATENILSFISQYLSLISLIALFLSGLASTYLFRTFVHHRFKEVAILQSLGMQARAAFSLSVIELLLISSVAAVLTTVIGYFLVPYVPTLLATFLPEGFVMVYSLKSIAITFLISILGSLIFCLPILISVSQFSLSYLFNSEINFNRSNQKAFWLSLSAILLFFYVMAIWLSESLKTGSIFTAAFFGFAVLTFFVGWGMLQLLSKRVALFKFPVSFVLRSFLHYRIATLFYFAAVSLSVMLITLVLQVEQSIQEEAGLPKGYQVPSLFFFNIVEETSGDFIKQAEVLESPITNLTPMLAGRITHINDISIKNNLGATPNDDYRQEEREEANRRVNLTFRDHIYSTESITKGKPFSTPAATRENSSQTEDLPIVELSLELGYAKEMGVKINDTLTVALLEVPYTFKGKVINLRRVKWNTFEPNFFIVVQPGILEDFPKTYIATVKTESEKKATLQTTFLQAFPNLSVLDVEKIIVYILGIINKLIFLVKVLALFALTLGMFLLFSVVNYQVRERRKEINMLKVIGSRLSKIKFILLGEYVFLGFLSILVGIFTSLLLYYLVTIYIFAGNVFFYPGLLINVTLSVLAVITVVSYLAASNILRQKPIVLIKEAY
ncbi:putative ABC transport system permease protein [Spirochaetota bacterium]|nr:putative ABC transport system permease protein [Spirochaetota bacterium]